MREDPHALIDLEKRAVEMTAGVQQRTKRFGKRGIAPSQPGAPYATREWTSHRGTVSHFLDAAA